MELCSEDSILYMSCPGDGRTPSRDSRCGVVVHVPASFKSSRRLPSAAAAAAAATTTTTTTTTTIVTITSITVISPNLQR
eukprot:gene8517-biopygen8194